MASGQPTHQPIQPPTTFSSILVKPTGPNLDMAYQWNSLRDINNKKVVTCNFCLKTSTGCFTRAKRHQMGLRGDVNSCTKITPDVKALLKEAFLKKKIENDPYAAKAQEMDEEEEGVEEIHNIVTGKRPATATFTASAAAKKGKTIKGPIDLLFFKKQMKLLLRQTSIIDSVDKEARERTIQYIEHFLVRNSIPFNVVRSKSFKLIIGAIGNYGKHLKVPSYHECRVPLLKKELEYTKNLMKDHLVESEKIGCTIMSDGWTDKKNRTLINFLVNCPSGSMFVKSVDASSYMKTGEKLFLLLDNFVEEVGENNVVQVVTDNRSNFVLAGKLLQAKRPNLFWTTCAAHCLDLMLEDIGKIARVKKTIHRGISLVGYIYNHYLNTMRRFTNKTELVRYGVTRFATTFLTLQRLHNKKNNLRKMFTSDDWLKSKAAKETKGKRATDTVLMPTFWVDVIYTLKAMGPIVQVLRLMDNAKKPAMGYIYEAMDRAKESIQNGFKGKIEKYKEVIDIIDRRWQCQLHHPLHAVGHYLNPEYFYGNPSLENDAEVMEGLYKCIQRLSANQEEEDETNPELSIYKRAGHYFGYPVAIRQRSKLAPAEWWKNFGSKAPHLQKIAIKVLSLTCSSSGCKRNWSIFEHVHSKKRSRFEHQRLQDLVYIKYNQSLKERFDCQDVKDSIVLKEVDGSNEWLLGEMANEDEEVVQENELVSDDLTWGDVAAATGVGEPITYTRQHWRAKNAAAASSSRPIGRRNQTLDQVEEQDSDESGSEEEEEQIYNSESDEDEDAMLDIGTEDDDI